MIRYLVLVLAAFVSTAASAQTVQTGEQALAQDAANYAQRWSVTPDEALRRLGAQQDSVAVTDRLRAALAPRLAGISFEHRPQYRIRVLLTGTEPLAEQAALAAGSPLPIVFQLGAQATRAQALTALSTHQTALAATLPGSRGMGFDPRTGELVLVVSEATAAAADRPATLARLRELTGVPVRIDAAGLPALASVYGGGRVEGLSSEDGRRYACTTAFVVRKAERSGVLTAAHCPDALEYIGPDRRPIATEFAGHWGIGRYDVQVNATAEADEPLFYADRRAGALRRLTAARTRESTRAGETVCHYGESSGYSCAEIELTDFAPPGALCGGPCEPVWLTVAGPQCRNGDSGGPVFLGTIAFGVTKGGSGMRVRCNFYYYMSTDFMPDGWSLLLGDGVSADR